MTEQEMISLGMKLDEANKLLANEVKVGAVLDKVKAIRYDPLGIEKERIEISIVTPGYKEAKTDVSGYFLKEGFEAVKDAICQRLQDRINYWRSEREKIKITNEES